MPSCVEITKNLDKQEATNAALYTFEIVNRYLLELNRLYPEFNNEFAITMFGKIELAVNIRPIVFQNEIDEIIHMITSVIINVSPKISQKLNQFWNAHLDMQKFQQKLIYCMTLSFVEKSQKEILKTSDKYMT